MDLDKIVYVIVGSVTGIFFNIYSMFKYKTIKKLVTENELLKNENVELRKLVESQNELNKKLLEGK